MDLLLKQFVMKFDENQFVFNFNYFDIVSIIIEANLLFKKNLELTLIPKLP